MCLGALTLAGCSGPPSGGWGRPGGSRAGGEEEPEEVAAPVMVGQASRGSIEATVSSASTIEAERQVVVTAEAMGRVTRVLVEEADVGRRVDQEPGPSSVRSWSGPVTVRVVCLSLCGPRAAAP